MLYHYLKTGGAASLLRDLLSTIKILSLWSEVCSDHEAANRRNIN